VFSLPPVAAPACAVAAPEPRRVGLVLLNTALEDVGVSHLPILPQREAQNRSSGTTAFWVPRRPARSGRPAQTLCRMGRVGRTAPLGPSDDLLVTVRGSLRSRVRGRRDAPSDALWGCVAGRWVGWDNGEAANRLRVAPHVVCVCHIRGA
jgi:hypothetical protein